MWRRSTYVSLALAGLMIGAALMLERLLPALTGEVRVADGDSLELGGERIRLEGIDAPELAQECGPPERRWPCGREARAALAALVKGAPVTCRPLDTDRYGRAVAVCRAGEVDIAERLVEQGFAIATSFSYAGAERGARAAKRGIWSGPFEIPADWRARAGDKGR
ncbi:thermonuclease family protein [Ancylobacter terrae]|uniref:thermonuclease family protein n=1 Tax=Ancylobacter sp. sgz301288 TaxID=3342077 RepID=UPI00385D7DC0